MQQVPEIQEHLDRRRAAAVALLVAGSFFMENLDGTVIANRAVSSNGPIWILRTAALL